MLGFHLLRSLGITWSRPGRRRRVRTYALPPDMRVTRPDRDGHYDARRTKKPRS